MKPVFIPFQEPLVTGTLLQRYKRFLADMELSDGSVVTVHCPNTGSMKSLLVPGSPTILWDSRKAERKYRLGWKAVRIEGCWVGVDTHLANRIAEAAIRAGVIEAFGVPDEILREQPMGNDSRVDLVLQGMEGRCWVEVKNVTLVERGMGRFPDAKSGRGLKHLKALHSMVRAGDRANAVQGNDRR